MVNLAIADNDRIPLSGHGDPPPREIPTSYETMEQLQKEYPEDRFFFICGADCLYTIEYWKCVNRLFAACTVLAAVRGDADIADMQEKIDALEKKFGAQIRLLPFRRIEISSSEIRERRRKGLSVRYLVPGGGESIYGRKGALPG